MAEIFKNRVMIQANELRVGNYVLYDGKITIVDNIYYDTINIDLASSDGIEIHNLSPIPITEELLLKCEIGSDIFPDGERYYTLINGRKLYIEYLHQLQNLYFALTGEELEINL